MRDYSPRLKPLARELRRDQTDFECRLWARLRRKQIQGVQFYRQRPVGQYIVDFYAPSVGLVVELDGSQHLEERVSDYDARRTDFLRSVGLEVLRFGNEDVVEDLEAVVGVIDDWIRRR